MSLVDDAKLIAHMERTEVHLSVITEKVQSIDKELAKIGRVVPTLATKEYVHDKIESHIDRCPAKEGIERLERSLKETQNVGKQAPQTKSTVRSILPTTWQGWAGLLAFMTAITGGGGYALSDASEYVNDAIGNIPNACSSTELNDLEEPDQKGDMTHGE